MCLRATIRFQNDLVGLRWALELVVRTSLLVGICQSLGETMKGSVIAFPSRVDGLLDAVVARNEDGVMPTHRGDALRSAPLGVHALLPDCLVAAAVTALA